MREIEIKEKFKSFVVSQRFKIATEFTQTSPDLIIEKNGKKIGVELKGSRSTSVFGAALGQLLFAKFKYNVDELWLVIPKQPSMMSKEWIDLLWKNKITILFYSQDKFLEFTPKLFRSYKRKSFFEIDKAVSTLLKEHSEGLTISQISKMLGIHSETIRAHLQGPFGSMSSMSLLKDKVVIKNNKFRLRPY